jgi:hypothetical protein
LTGSPGWSLTATGVSTSRVDSGLLLEPGK